MPSSESSSCCSSPRELTSGAPAKPEEEDAAAAAAAMLTLFGTPAPSPAVGPMPSPMGTSARHPKRRKRAPSSKANRSQKLGSPASTAVASPANGPVNDAGNDFNVCLKKCSQDYALQLEGSSPNGNLVQVVLLKPVQGDASRQRFSVQQLTEKLSAAQLLNEISVGSFPERLLGSESLPDCLPKKEEELVHARSNGVPIVAAKRIVHSAEQYQKPLRIPLNSMSQESSFSLLRAYGTQEHSHFSSTKVNERSLPLPKMDLSSLEKSFSENPLSSSAESSKDDCLMSELSVSSVSPPSENSSGSIGRSRESSPSLLETLASSRDLGPCKLPGSNSYQFPASSSLDLSKETKFVPTIKTEFSTAPTVSSSDISSSVSVMAKPQKMGYVASSSLQKDRLFSFNGRVRNMQFSFS